MPRRTEPEPAPVTAPRPGDTDVSPDEPVEAAGVRLDLSDLPVLGITRRRAGYALGVLLAGWVLVVFARQVSEAAAATSRADDLREANAALEAHVADLRQELALIQRPTYVEQQARSYGWGGGREMAFTLEAGAPPLPDDAPGSAAVRLGATPRDRTPLDAWLELLFGPSA